MEFLTVRPYGHGHRFFPNSRSVRGAEILAELPELRPGRELGAVWPRPAPREREPSRPQALGIEGI